MGPSVIISGTWYNADKATENKADKAAKPAATGKAAQNGKGFQKNHSGNPNGRPKGSRNKASLIVEQMVDGEAEVNRPGIAGGRLV